MYPKIIYEAFPYVYMTTGIAEITYFNSVLSTGSGLLLFLAGALVWVMRSNARRTDPEATRKNINKSEVLYELKPFLLIGLGVLIISYFNTWMIYPIAGLTVLLGFYIVLLRNMHRSKRVAFNRKV